MSKEKILTKKKNKELAIEAKAKSERLRYMFFLGLILAYTFILFAKSFNYSFVNWDDNSYILDNLLIQDLSFSGLKKIFSTPVIGMYNPITFVIYAIEYKFWELNPKAYHTINLIFHLIATVVVFRFIYELCKRYETSVIVALLFAIHPMHVSVITWVSETKTSLYFIFYLMALIYYIRYLRNNYATKNLIYVGIFFLLSVLSKPAAVTLTPMLLLIDYYLDRKIDKKAILEKVPFFALSIFFGILTILTHVEAEDSIFESNNDYSLINNILVSNYSIVFYINKLFAPLNLCTIYPYPKNADFLPFKYYFSIIIIPLIMWLVFKSKSFRKELIFGLLFFAIAISVMLRIVPSGFFRASNVYSYESYTGLFFIIGQFFSYTIHNRFSYSNRVKKYVILLLAILIVFYSVSTSDRINKWENSITLFNDIIEKKPKLALAWNNRGISKLETGDVQGALFDISKSIELDPKYAVAYNNRGKILVDMKEYDAALRDLTTALKLDTDYAEAFINKGNVEFYKGQYEGALADYNRAIHYNPSISVAYKNRGKIETFKKDDNAALKDLEKALVLDPHYYDAYIDRGNIMYNEAKYDEALKDYNSAIRINPNSGEAYNNRAVVKMMRRDTVGATEDAEKATELGYSRNKKN